MMAGKWRGRRGWAVLAIMLLGGLFAFSLVEVGLARAGTHPAEVPPLRFPPAYLGLAFPATSRALATDPRTGGVADEYVRAIREQQLVWQYLPTALNAYGDCQPNLTMTTDVTTKFGANYVIRPLEGGQPYVWGPTPTYEWGLSHSLLYSLLHYCHRPGPWDDDVLALLGLTDLPDAPAGASDPALRAGLLDPDHAYAALAADQCAALAAAEDAHATNAPDRGDLQLAFEGTARDLEEELLFTLIWNPGKHPNRTADELAGLERYVMAAHAARTAAFHCDTGAPPDMVAVVAYGLEHGIGHFCMATDEPALIVRKVCLDRPIDECGRVTCAELATELPS